MRRPRGNKTRKSVAKRFKITGTGKVVFRGAGRRHLLQTKNSKRRRSLRKASVLGPTDVYRITQNLPFSHWALKSRFLTHLPAQYLTHLVCRCFQWNNNSQQQGIKLGLEASTVPKGHPTIAQRFSVGFGRVAG